MVHPIQLPAKKFGSLLKRVAPFVVGFELCICNFYHFAKYIISSDTIYVVESISRWYGVGGSWTDIALPQYVQLDRKPGSGCAI